MSAAAEYEDMDVGGEPLTAKEKRKQLPQQVLKKVVVPVNGRSSTASSLSSVRDQSSEHDTRNTSIIVTPPESLVKEERSLKCPSRTSSSIPSVQPEIQCKGKRKRLELDELLEADALLAQKLQEREYREDNEMAPRLRRARNGPIEDSEDSSLLSNLNREHSPDPDDFSELDMASSGKPSRRRHKALLWRIVPADVEGDRFQEETLDESEISEIPVPRNKRVKTIHRTSLPSRAARDIANKSIKDKSSSGILDSEDSGLSDRSDGVSLFGSDLGPDAFEDSEDADEGPDDVVGAENMTFMNNPSSAPTASPATGRRGHRGATNPTRGRRSWQRRIEDRVSSEMHLNSHAGLRHTLGCKRATKVRESAS